MNVAADTSEDSSSPSAILRLRTIQGDATYACGYFYDVLAWEHENAWGAETLDVDVSSDSCLPVDLVQELHASPAVLVELDGRRPSHDSLIRTVALATENVRLADPIWTLLPDWDAISPTARKRPLPQAPLTDWQLLDLEAVTIPTQSVTQAASFAFACRRARMLVAHRLCVVLWEEPLSSEAHNWERGQWPRYGIPGSSGLVDLTVGPHSDASGIALALVDRIAEHNLYFLRDAHTAIEIAESGFFAAMARSGDPAPQRLLESLDLVGLLERYFFLLRRASIRLQRRLETSILFADASTTVANSGACMIDRWVASVLDAAAAARHELRDAVSIVSATASVTALRQQIEERAGAWRFRRLVAVGAVAYSLVSLFISAYGANIQELTPGTTGQLWSLLAGSVAITLSVVLLTILAWLGWRFVIWAKGRLRVK